MSLTKMKKLQKILSTLVLIIVMGMSGIGMFRDGAVMYGILDDTIFTCIFCLTMVMLVDRFEEYDTHDKG